MTIIGSGGKLSGGKTVTGIFLLNEVGIKQGKKIISNIRLKDIDYTFIENDYFIRFIKQNIKNQKALMKLFFNSFLLLDEIRGLISARKSTSNLNELLTSFFMMLGKLDCDLYYTYQVLESMVDKQLRLVTDYILKTYRITKDGKLYSGPRIAKQDILIRVEVYIYENEIEQFIGSFVYDPKPYFNRYNTREITLVDRDKYTRGGRYDLRSI